MALPPTIRAFAALTKLPISALSTLSAAAGHIAFVRGLHWGILPASGGVLLVALAACALNEWQERDLDARMERTRRRPLPSGALGPGTALVIAAVLALSGLGLLWVLFKPAAAGLALLALAWYNGLYTPLKRITAFAVLPGSIIGALPPAIGWAAAGGDPLDPHVLVLSFFFFIWQVPHFWLLVAVHGEDYERAGFPSLTRIFTARQLSRLIFIWMLFAGGSALLLPVYGLTVSPWVSMGLLAAGVWIALCGGMLLRAGGDRKSFRVAFRWINLHALLVMALLALDGALA